MAAYRYYQGVYDRKQSNKKKNIKTALTRHDWEKKRKKGRKRKRTMRQAPPSTPPSHILRSNG